MSKSINLKGRDVLWEVASYREDFLQSQSLASFRGDFLGSLEIVGKDASDFLHRLSTLNIKTFSEDNLRYGAFLTGKGTLIALGWFEKIDGGFRFHTFFDQIDEINEYLNQMHFGEKLTLVDSSERRRLIGITGRPIENAYPDEAIPGLFWLSRSLDSEGQLPPHIGFRVFEFLRRQGKVPRLYQELSKTQLFLEGDFELSISPNKGCYPGQEVVERIHTYGRVNKKLQLLQIEGDLSLLTKGTLFYSENKEPAGHLESWDFFPADESRALGVALLHKNFFQYSSSFRSSNEKMVARIVS